MIFLIFLGLLFYTQETIAWAIFISVLWNLLINIGEILD